MEYTRSYKNEYQRPLQLNYRIWLNSEVYREGIQSLDEAKEIGLALFEEDTDRYVGFEDSFGQGWIFERSHTGSCTEHRRHEPTESCPRLTVCTMLSNDPNFFIPETARRLAMFRGNEEEKGLALKRV